MDFQKNGPIEWTPACTKAFEKTKALISKETILIYPDFPKKITIHTDISDVQLGAVVIQEGKLLAFYSQKWSKAQINYTIIEKEHLKVLETLKEFWNILLGHEIEVLTDHKNLTYESI